MKWAQLLSTKRVKGLYAQASSKPIEGDLRTFTRSARDLAHANRVRLIDGNDLKDLFPHPGTVNPSDVSAHTPKAVDGAGTGPTVIFHDISPGQQLIRDAQILENRLKKQAEEGRKK